MEIVQLGSCLSSKKTIVEHPVRTGDACHIFRSFKRRLRMDRGTRIHKFSYEDKCRIRVKIGRYIEMTMPPMTTPRKTIITGSMRVIRLEMDESASSS